MRKPFVKGGRALTLVAALLCGATSLGSFTAFGTATQAEGQAGAQAGAQVFTPGVAGQITPCEISGNRQSVEIGFSGNGDVTGADGDTYIFEIQLYEEELGSHSSFIASSPTLGTASVSAPLNLGTPQDKLYSRFVLAVFDETKFIKVGQPHYITNPELIARNQTPFNDPLTKKGLMAEIDMLSDASDLGVKHVTTSAASSQIMGTGINYQYGGETYHFNKGMVGAYDKTINALSNKGMMVTAILLSNQNPNAPDLVYPGTRKNSNTFYYVFNAGTKTRFDQIKAIASFLAQHYDGDNPNYGKVSNWVIGNEINNQQWNYMGSMNLTNHMKAYQKAFQVIYTAIKSTNVNDQVYFSLDYNWIDEIDGKLKYGGKGIVNSFNFIANTQGQVDWGLAYHPYPCPMTEPEFWNDLQSTGLLTNDFNSPVINSTNPNVLADCFVQGILRAPTGNVRHAILTEQGFTSYSPTRGNIPEIQAAVYACSYYLVNNNPYIGTYTVSHQVDAPSEAGDGLKFGLWKCDMNRSNLIVATKREEIWQVFRDIDKKNATLEVTEFAEPVISISKWSDVVPDFKWKNLEK